jgi:hypothetical protein
MAAEVCSSPEGSPFKLVGPFVHVHNPGHARGISPSGRQPARVQPKQLVVPLSDDESQLNTDDDEDCVEVLGSNPDNSDRMVSRKRPHPESSTLDEKGVRVNLAMLLQQLDVEELPTHGHENNCLWFAAQLALGKLGQLEQFTNSAEAASSIARLTIHEEALRVWPFQRQDAIGDSQTWCAGFSRRRLKRVFSQCLMMGEPHLFALAHLLQCSIIVVDTRLPRLCITQYGPGYKVRPTLAIRDAYRIGKSDGRCIWLRLHENHFRALVHNSKLD